MFSDNSLDALKNSRNETNNLLQLFSAYFLSQNVFRSNCNRNRRIGNYLQKPTSELMAAIQLGIGQSITCLIGKPKRDLLLQDFSIVETVQFPRSVVFATVFSSCTGMLRNCLFTYRVPPRP